MKRRLSTAICAAAMIAATASLVACGAPSASPPTPRHPPVTIVNMRVLGHAAVRTVLTNGAAPTTDYLVGDTIHPSDGPPMSLPPDWDISRTWNGPTLVGRIGDAWYVDLRYKDSNDVTLYRVTRQGVSRIDSDSSYLGTVGWYLSADDSQIIKVRTDDEMTRLTVLSPTGEVLGHHEGGAGGALVGASDGTVWYSGGVSWAPVERWDVEPDTTAVLPVTGYLADPAHDLLFTLPRGDVPGGLTSLSQPSAALRWSADFTAVAVSPDGTRVVGFRGSTGGDSWVLEIRNVADGSMVQTIELGVSPEGTSDLWWEDAEHILFNRVTKGRQTVLVRCSTGGACEFAAGPVSDDLRFSHRQIHYLSQRMEEGISDSTGIDPPGPLVTPDTLPLGPGPQSDYLVGRQIHTAAGGTIQLPATWPTSGGRSALIELVGEADGSYYVQRWSPHHELAQLYRVTPSSTELVDSIQTFFPVVGWYLTSDDRRLVRAVSDGYGDDSEKVMDLDGTEIASHENRDDSNFNGATSTEVWYTATTEGSLAQRWSIGDGSVTALSVGGYLAVPDRDLLFTAPGLGIGPGVTSLSRPGVLTWEAQFRAVAVSPDGTKVLGYAGFSAIPGQSVQIRNLSDGSLVTSFRFPARGVWGDIWWESDSSVLLSYTTGDNWLIRCSTDGTCQRVARDESDSLGYTHRAVPPWHPEATH